MASRNVSNIYEEMPDSKLVNADEEALKRSDIREENAQLHSAEKEYGHEVAFLTAEGDALSQSQLVLGTTEETKVKKEKFKDQEPGTENLKRKAPSAADERMEKRPKLAKDARAPIPINMATMIPHGVLIKIMKLIPIAQWPKLERVSREFRSAVHGCWNSLKEIKIDRDLVTPEELMKGGDEMLDTILDKLITYAPNIKSISGFKLMDQKWPLSSTTERLCKLIRLENIDFNSFVNAAELAAFLASSTGRQLKKLDISECELLFDDPIDETDPEYNALRSAFGPPLALKELICAYAKVAPGIFELVDASILTMLNLARTKIAPTSLISMINGAGQLERLVFSFMDCGEDLYFGDGVCRMQHRLENQQLIRAVAEMENLSSLEIANIAFNSYDQGHLFDEEYPACLDLEADLKQLVQDLGQRRRLSKLSITDSLCTVGVVKAITEHMGHLNSLESCVCVLESASASASPWSNMETLKLCCTTRHHCGHLLMPPDITNLIGLKCLHLGSCYLKIGLDVLISMPNLEELCLPLCKMRNVTCLLPAVDSRLEVLDLNLLEALGEDMITETPMITDTLMIGLVKKLPKLRSLNIRGSEVTDATLEAIAISCPRLQALYLWLCNGVTATGAQFIIDGCKQLRVIEPNKFPEKK